jgi:hypothetical protein
MSVILSKLVMMVWGATSDLHRVFKSGSLAFLNELPKKGLSGPARGPREPREVLGAPFFVSAGQGYAYNRWSRVALSAAWPGSEPSMHTLTITVRPRAGPTWPVVAEEAGQGGAPSPRMGETLVLEEQELAVLDCSVRRSMARFLQGYLAPCHLVAN